MLRQPLTSCVSHLHNKTHRHILSSINFCQDILAYTTLNNVCEDQRMSCLRAGVIFFFHAHLKKVATYIYFSSFFHCCELGNTVLILHCQSEILFSRKFKLVRLTRKCRVSNSMYFALLRDALFILLLVLNILTPPS